MKPSPTRPRWRRLTLTALGTACTIATAAAADPADPADPADRSAAASATEPPAVSKPAFEGAIGPLLSWAPEYSGSSTRKARVKPGFMLRYGRYTVSNAGGFVSRRDDDVGSGLGVDLSRDVALRASVGLRIDRGRRADAAAALAGVDEVRRTLRLRASASRLLGGGWKLGAGINADLLGHGGGELVDFGISHERRLAPRLSWSVGSGLGWASGRYMRSWYGVSPAASQRSGYAAYSPGAGLRDISVGTSWQLEIEPRWVAFWGASASRLVGPAGASPLTRSPQQWSLSSGLAWRF